MKISIEPDSATIIYKSIQEELVSQLNTARAASLKEISDLVQRYTLKIMSNSDFAVAFSGAELRGSFGIKPKEYKGRIDYIVQQIASDTHILSAPFKIFGTSIEGGWTLAMGTSLFDKLKNSLAAVTITEKGVTVPWLKWTLEVGNAVIISDFRVNFKLGKGRSGFANMIPNKVIGYRVPPAFSGTDHDNWITREIIPELDNYADIILKTLDKYAK